MATTVEATRRQKARRLTDCMYTPLDRLAERMSANTEDRPRECSCCGHRRTVFGAVSNAYRDYSGNRGEIRGKDVAEWATLVETQRSGLESNTTDENMSEYRDLRAIGGYE